MFLTDRKHDPENLARPLLSTSLYNPTCFASRTGRE
ncbi:hypothetical protein Pan44_06170 [Caulifigura coniformis]|uniref:Uncharacterized protein n=1 Tax=Caulifigura coniformis TaxID=2527983 RepID=A0A517S900_9PLAN|nr:hypothetical protein Pan44_06170 [Caulifigura coniformis]